MNWVQPICGSDHDSPQVSSINRLAQLCVLLDVLLHTCAVMGQLILPYHALDNRDDNIPFFDRRGFRSMQKFIKEAWFIQANLRKNSGVQDYENLSPVKTHVLESRDFAGRGLQVDLREPGKMAPRWNESLCDSANGIGTNSVGVTRGLR